MKLPLEGLFELGGKIIDKLIPDPKQKAEAQLKLIELERTGELEETKVRLSAILAEAQSADPWTSRARPSFLYVVYVLILWSLPMGVLFVFEPEAAERFTKGFNLWLSSIPEPILTLFGVVMTGYVIGRSYEKVRGKVR